MSIFDAQASSVIVLNRFVRFVCAQPITDDAASTYVAHASVLGVVCVLCPKKQFQGVQSSAHEKEAYILHHHII